MTQPRQDYNLARDLFLQFKRGLVQHPDVLGEVQGAMGLLIEEYNTTYRENRFIVGGAVEEMIAAAMRCIGLQNVRTVGVENIGCDIFVGNQGFSLKTSFTGRNEAIGMINKQGDSSPVWVDPTIFVLASRGIGYADPLLLPNATRDGSDQVSLPRGPLYSLFDRDPQWLLGCHVPTKPSSDEPPRSVASRAVAIEILLRRDREGNLLYHNLFTAIQ